MASERFVALGLAHPRSAWFREVARWATAAALPLEFIKCLSREELRARLASSRAFSALVVDGSLAGVDRDLIHHARRIGCAVLVVDDGRVERDWKALGASAVLAPFFDRAALLDALHQHASMIGRTDDVPGEEPSRHPLLGAWRGVVVAVTGPGGTGASTAAMALAQALGDDVRHGEMVLLADLALHADQGMLHDAGDVVPGVLELVDAHRHGRPSIEEIRSLTFRVAPRRYHLMLGLRRHRDWTALRPRAFEVALDGLRRSYRVVVADVDADVEGEESCGSVDVEERNVMARSTLPRADVVLVVGNEGVKGVHSLVRVACDLIAFGVAPERIVPVVNRAPRGARARAAVGRSIATLLGAAAGAGCPGPVFLPERRKIDDVLRDGVRLPASLGAPLVGAMEAVLGRVGSSVAEPAPEPVAIAPGSLGTLTD